MTKVPAGKVYATDLDDDQWEIIFPAIELPTGGRPRTTPLRAVINAILYQTKTGCPWHMLPRDSPPEGTVRRYFHFFKRTGQLGRINDSLHRQVRVREGRNPEPSLAIIDSQSVVNGCAES